MLFRSRLTFLILGLMLGFVLLLSCVPSPPDVPTTTSPITTSTIVISEPPTSATNTAGLQANLNDGFLFVDSTVVSDGTLKPPAGAVIVFGPNGKLVRSISSTGAAVDVSSPNVVIHNLKVVGSDPCFWVVESSPNPLAVGEMYSQYDPRREEQAALYVRPGADGLRVDGLFANDVWGDGLTLLGGNNMVFKNVFVRCAGRSGISNVNSSNVVVDGGSVSGMLLWGLNIEPTGVRSVSGYVVRNFTVGHTTNQWLFVGGPGFNCKVFGVDVRGVSLLPQASSEFHVASCVSLLM